MDGFAAMRRNNLFGVVSVTSSVTPSVTSSVTSSVTPSVTFFCSSIQLYGTVKLTS